MRRSSRPRSTSIADQRRAQDPAANGRLDGLDAPALAEYSGDPKTPYRVLMCVFPSGERYPALVRRDTGLPVFMPNLFVATQLRPLHLAAATLECCQHALKLLLFFSDIAGIDLSERIESGKMLAASVVPEHGRARPNPQRYEALLLGRSFAIADAFRFVRRDSAMRKPT